MKYVIANAPNWSYRTAHCMYEGGLNISLFFKQHLVATKLSKHQWRPENGLGEGAKVVVERMCARVDQLLVEKDKADQEAQREKIKQKLADLSQEIEESQS